MYLTFYGLSEKPFSQTPDPRFLYWNDSYREALASLRYGIEERKGFLTMIGEAGTGKTTLLRKLLDDLGPDVVSVLLFNPNVSFEEILEYTLSELGIAAPSGRKLAMMQRLNEFLMAAFSEGKNTILVIDEAQDLGPEVLESLRLLSNLETSRDKILQIVLSGQPELATRLARDDLRQLKQRIAVRCRLEPLQRSELPAFLRARLAVAGGADDLFGEDCLDAIWGFARGIPRLVNTVCDNALLLGYAVGKRRIDRQVIDEVVADLGKLDVVATTWHSTTHGTGPGATHPSALQPGAPATHPAPGEPGHSLPATSPAPAALGTLQTGGMASGTDQPSQRSESARDPLPQPAAPPPHASAPRRGDGILPRAIGLAATCLLLGASSTWLLLHRGQGPDAAGVVPPGIPLPDGAPPRPRDDRDRRGTLSHQEAWPASEQKAAPSAALAAAQSSAPTTEAARRADTHLASQGPANRARSAEAGEDGGSAGSTLEATPASGGALANAPAGPDAERRPEQRLQVAAPAPPAESRPSPQAPPLLDSAPRAATPQDVQDPATEAPGSRPSQIQVQPGDTLYELAARAYGTTNFTTLDMLRAANPDIADLNRISVGQTILLPDPGSGARILGEGPSVSVLAITTPILERAQAVQRRLQAQHQRDVQLDSFSLRDGRRLYRVLIKDFHTESQAREVARSLGSILQDPDEGRSS